MQKGKGISRETLRGISEELTGVKVDEGEWEEMLIRVGDILKGVRALDEVDLTEVSPAFSYNPGGERNAGY
jgi:putative NADH-flavin reductase